MVKIPRISGILRTTLIASALLVGSTAFAAITVGLSTTGQSVDITYSKLTLNTPASVASGDLLLATVAIKNGTTGVITAPSGWTLIRRTDKTTDVSRDGSEDEVGVWNRALTETEVSSLYNSGAGRQYPF